MLSQKNNNMLDSRIYKRNIISNVSIIVLIRFEEFGILKSINKGPQDFNNPEIMEMLGFGPSHNNTEILLDQN